MWLWISRIVNVIAWLVGVTIVIVWITDPDGPWEPWAALVACITVPLTTFFNWKMSQLDKTPPQDRLLERVHEEPLSKTLPAALRLAKRAHDPELERWCRLELYGYNKNGGMTTTDTVPDYRMITGRWVNDAGQYLDLSNYPDLAVLNRMPLRDGVAYLEQLAAKDTMLVVAQDRGKALIKDHMGIDLRGFQFHTVEVNGILSDIKNHLFEKLDALPKGKK